MPRVRPPNHGTASFASPMKAIAIPLNDDTEEKAERLKSRQALHSRTMSQMKAAVTPQRKRRSMLGNEVSTPERDGGDGDDPFNVRGEHVTPMKRMPILANFEEWMKMATDNKINATNSWNFALIDYFHDMSLLKEGDGVNFQKASCTLDGCVKIYTSRVDSVATETGKLLSGLADSGNKRRKGGDAEEGAEEGEGDEENEDGTKKKGRKKAQRSAEATLVNSFDQLRLKKMELEFAVDPLFKKASADFDEGGAKGLLLNHLSIDSTGRIVFDSSDDTQEPETEDTRRDSMEPQCEREKNRDEEPVVEDGPVDVAALGARFFPDLDQLDDQDICPSLKTFELGAGDASLDLPFLKAPENWRDEHPAADGDSEAADGAGAGMDNESAPFGLQDDGDMGLGADFDMTQDAGFGEGGEAWARDAALHPQMQPFDAGAGADTGDAVAEVGVFDTNSNAYGVTLQHQPELVEQENILNYFDNALQKNWAGPEHWKITRIKEANKPAAPQRVRKEKEPFEIDFAAPMSQELANAIYTTATSNSQISLPKKDWRSKTRNLLPDDKHFHSKDLLKLFLKPKAIIGSRSSSETQQQKAGAPDDVDEAYWAQRQAGEEDDEPIVQGDYDANFFQDDGLPLLAGGLDEDDDVFHDAVDGFVPAAMDDADLAGGPTGPGIDGVNDPNKGEGAFGANLIAQSRRMRPEYVQYARVAKKVDVRRLKEEMWRGIGYDRGSPAPNTIPALSKSDTEQLRFTDIMNNLQHVYPRQQMADISTSYGFICLLHLANEKGLVIENVDDWTDLSVRKDFEAVVHEGDL